MTEHEQRLVARRAAGEYAVLDLCRAIWQKYRKERSVYTVFLGVIFGNRGDGRTLLGDWDTYEATASAVLEQHPLGPVPVAQLRRGQILEALRRPWPTRGVEPTE